MLAATASTAWAARAYTDPFDGPELAPFWTFRTPDNNDNYEFQDGWLVFDIQAGQDVYKRGVDRAPFLLTDPPADDARFSIETRVDVVMDQGFQPPASHAGLIFFREDNWAYSLWGPYNNVDIRLEDVIDQDYRWRQQTQIGADPPGGIADSIYLKIEKRGDELEFFWKLDEAEDWVSAGVDQKLGPQYEPGTYQVGLFLRNWGGSVAQKARFDYFHSPQIVGLSVDPEGKAATMWGALKRR